MISGRQNRIPFILNSFISDQAARVDGVLQRAINDIQSSSRLAEAMRYSTLNGGKRLRAALVYAGGIAVAAPWERMDSVAAAVECIHAYSLIHDDLPAMDDDDLRRGQPSNHIFFDEATAILAGDALQTLAFELVTADCSGLSDSQSRQICLKLARNAGHRGMVGGQMLDIQATEQQLQRRDLENLHRRKTGALIEAAVICGTLCGDSPRASDVQALEEYSQHIGLAFQVIDDVLDVESTTEKLGKPSGADQALGKSTYPAIMGLQQSKQFAHTLYQQAMASISAISDNEPLLDLAALIINREH